MNGIATIRQLLSEPIRSSGLLLAEMIVVTPPATPGQIAALELSLPRRLSAQHRCLLSEWNGLSVDVIRFAGAPPAPNGVPTITELQPIIPATEPHWVGIGSDPDGFVYAEDAWGAVHSIDTDGGSVQLLAPSLDVFITDYLFGARAAEFCGPEWFNELKFHGLIRNA